jgi:uncharacterized membrane protein
MNNNQAKSIGVTGVAGALAALVVWLFSLVRIPVPAEVSDAFLTLFSAGLLYLSHKENISIPLSNPPEQPK